jgi:hypothetical protein
VHADVVGIPDRLSIPLLLAMYSERAARPLFGIVSIYEYLEDAGHDGAFASTTSAASFFHTDLLDHLPALIEGRDIVLVTCHRDLGDAVGARFGARDVQVLTVPAQSVLQTGGRGPTGHFPGRYREIVAELARIPPGALVLVGAGILAEPYCEAARRAGAVAVDIGSAIDVWAGVKTRVWGQTDDLYEKHRLL